MAKFPMQIDQGAFIHTWIAIIVLAVFGIAGGLGGLHLGFLLNCLFWPAREMLQHWPNWKAPFEVGRRSFFDWVLPVLVSFFSTLFLILHIFPRG